MIPKTARGVFSWAVIRHVSTSRKAYMRYTMRMVESRIAQICSQPFSPRTLLDLDILVSQYEEADTYLTQWRNSNLRAVSEKLIRELDRLGYTKLAVGRSDNLQLPFSVRKGSCSAVGAVMVYTDVVFMVLAASPVALAGKRYQHILQLCEGKTKRLRTLPPMAK